MVTMYLAVEEGCLEFQGNTRSEVLEKMKSYISRHFPYRRENIAGTQP